MFYFTMAIELAGGLGLFIYGMRQMSEGLQKAAGKKLKQLLHMLTSNRLAGVMVGTGVTSIIQSSSATTVMVVGFVNAGLMTLKQAIGVIMGANIGTTVTAQLIAFKLSDYSLHAIALGAFLYLFAKRDRTGQLGQIVLGFGMLFLGMTIMKETMAPLEDAPVFKELMATFGVYPILGLLFGTALTVLLQSSSASIGILISLISVGVLDYRAAIPVLMGGNIGTTCTALLSSIGANRNAKRAAMAHATFNILGAGLIVLFLYVIPDFAGFLNRFVLWFSEIFGHTPGPERMVANTHTIFNVLNTLLWFPFVGVIVTIVHKLVPRGEEPIKRGLVHLDERMLETPGMVMDQVKMELVRMHELAGEMLHDARKAFIDGEMDYVKEIQKKEAIMDEIEEEMVRFLTRIPQSALSQDDNQTLDMYYTVIDNIESMGDDADNLAVLTEFKDNDGIEFSGKAYDALVDMYDYLFELLDRSIDLIKTEDMSHIPVIIDGEEHLDQLQHRYRDEHMQRLRTGECDPDAGIIYLEALEDIEHVSDQFADVAQCFLERDEAGK